RLAREYPESMITRPFPFNSFYVPNVPEKSPVIDPARWRLNVTGRVDKTDDWRLADLRALPQTTHVTRHICIEGWSAIGKFTGVRFSEFL
ncbi:molybdopterin-dependent oxidoreductase, partial [Salmonella enterica]|uniref:molybdopterin-dependent oxidoreductase n=1 Tax=Salmonella enterica TaxID=28901 RepID=UPI003D2B44A3